MYSKMIALTGLTLLMILPLSSGAVDMPEYTRTDYPIHDVARFIFTGSENDDSYPDLIAVDKSGAINVLLAGPNAVYETAIVTDTGIKAPTTAIADDFNNDGLSDICINDTLFVATGGGEFETPRPLGIERLQTLASTDMNGDGKKDLIAIVIINTAPDMRAAELRTYFGKGDGTFGEPVKTRIVLDYMADAGTIIDDSGWYLVLYAGDLNDDGVPDLLVRHKYAADYSLLYFTWSYIGSSDGMFTRSSMLSWLPIDSYNIVVHDFNNDGKKDVLYYGNSAVLYAGENNGIFSYVWENQLEVNTRIFSTADMNDDGVFEFSMIQRVEDVITPYYRLASMPVDSTSHDMHRFSIILTNNDSGWEWQYGLEFEGIGIIPYDFNDDNCSDFIIPNLDLPFISTILSKVSIVNVIAKNEDGDAILNQNYPNPFNASTSIPYLIQNSGNYELEVYDIIGKKTTTVFSGYRSKGLYRAKWDGKSDNGSEVASGTYFTVLKQKKEVISSKRLLLIK